MVKKKIFKQCLAGIMSLAMTITLFPAGTLGTVQAADVQAPQPVLHYDMSHADGKLTDVSGNSHNGLLKNFADADFSTGNGETELNFDGTEKYVEIPSGVIKGADKEAFTIEASYTNDTQSEAWLFTLGTTVGAYPNVKNYLFVSPYSNQGDFTGKMLGAIKNGETELRYAKESALVGETEGKNIVTVVFDNGNVTYYLNGKKSGTTESGYKIQDILNANSTDTCVGYIGKSLYDGDAYFKGALSDFKIYETALTEEQVTGIHNEKTVAWEADRKVIKVQKALLETMLNGNKGIEEVSTDLAFPAEIDGVSLTWTSSNTNVVAADGKVHATAEGQKVTVKAAGAYEGKTFEEQWELNVITAEGLEYKDFAAMVIPNADDIKGNITLADAGTAGSPIVWTSSNETVISSQPQGDMPAGVVTRQDADTKVKLTATLKQPGGDKTKEFNVTVKKKASVGEMTDYVFAYFAGDGAGEQIFLAASKDGMHWKELNNGEAVLKSEMGTTGLRDPYILRSPEGDKFYLVATDLSIALANWNWGGVQRNGSQALMVWESDDLINWTNQRMAVVSAKIDAGCTWAPEVFYDDTTGEYILFWSSLVKEHNYDKHRVYYVKTRDFYTFTDPQIWIENSFSTIDATVIRGDDGKYYRFCKNENSGAKYIYEEVADTLLGEWKGVGWTDTPKKIGGGEGPCCFRINDDDREAVGANYCLLIDDFGGVRYYPMLTEGLETGEFTDAKDKASLPKKPCHGTVMNITNDEYKALMAKWGTVTLADDSIPDYVSVGYTLPAEVDVVFDEEKSKVAVNWDNTANDFIEAGTVEVTGTIPSLGDKKISKTIEVISDNLLYLIDSGVGEWNKDLSRSGYFEAVKSQVNLRNEVPDQIYQEGSWGFVNPQNSSGTDYENAGNRTNSEDSIYTNGWWARDGKKCEYIIPLENGSYMATGYFAEWWNSSRPIKFYAEYTDASGKTVQSEAKNIALSGSNARQTATIVFDIAGVTDKADVHFYAENADGNEKPAPVIAGLSVEKYISVTEVTLDKTSLSLSTGGTAILNATVKPAQSTKRKVVWASDNERVAKVDNGKVTAVAAGKAKITATAGGKTATCEVTVNKPSTVVPVTGVTLTPKKSALTLALGKKATFGASVAPTNATNKKVSWSTSNSKVASISKPDKNGKITVTAKKAGTATIKVTTANGKTQSCKITVVSLNKTKLTLGKGETFSLKVSGTKKKVAWSASSKNVTVKNGKITAKKAGKKAVTIKAKVDGVTLSCKVTVKNAPKKISLNKKSQTLKKGKTFQIKVKFPKNTASNKLTYKSSKPKVAKVDANGKVKALKKGKSTITVTTFNKKKAKITITVK